MHPKERKKIFANFALVAIKYQTGQLKQQMVISHGSEVWEFQDLGKSIIRFLMMALFLDC